MGGRKMAKSMKRMIALVLMMAIVFGMLSDVTLVMAAEENANETIVITQETQGNIVEDSVDTAIQEDKVPEVIKNEEEEVEEPIQQFNLNEPNELEASELAEDEQSKVGWKYIDGEWYYYNEAGEKVFGWINLGGVWYYLDGDNAQNPGAMLASEHKKINGRIYAFSSSGAMKTAGWIREVAGWYYAESNGALAEGWSYIGSAWYYFDVENEQYPGLMVANDFRILGGRTFFFQESGAMQKGWVLRPEGWYYTDIYGAKVFGWQMIGARWYYMDAENEQYPGLMVADDFRILDGRTFYFQKSGAMQTGWVLRPEGWYYADIYGAKMTGWLQIDVSKYYLDPDNDEYPGLMLQNCEKQIGDLTYVFTASGAMRAGWNRDDNGNWYYYDIVYGQQVSGWQRVGSTWYYLDPNNGNKMVSNGWKQIGNVWYYFYAGGAMATNWLQVGDTWYYMGDNGAMRTGWQLINGNWYYFYSGGAMAYSTVIDGYTLQANGAMLTGQQAVMGAKAQLYTSNTSNLILVDRAACKVAVFSGRIGNWNMIKYWDCAPGKPSTPTVSGTFTVKGKGTYFDSGSSRCYWYTQFYGNYLFHSVLYSKYNGSLVDGRVGMQLSHGCVRLKIENAKWIYDTIPAGTKVVIY